jgi:serine/threonine protein kinase
VLVHNNNIKLADFGLSKRIEEASKKQTDLFGIIPYIDPKRFINRRDGENSKKSYSLNEKSDVYSVGVLLWEISSGRPPFDTGESYDGGLAIQILLGYREKVIPGTSVDYTKLFAGK